MVPRFIRTVGYQVSAIFELFEIDDELFLGYRWKDDEMLLARIPNDIPGGDYNALPYFLSSPKLYYGSDASGTLILFERVTLDHVTAASLPSSTMKIAL